MSSLRLGKYVLTERLAQGGMAEIFLASARGEFGFSRRVVVKRLLPHLADRPEVVQLFLDEARLLARLHHPRIVQVLDLGSADGQSFQALEYLEGADLASLLARGPIPLELALRIALAIAEALGHVHAARGDAGERLQLVHGDVAPGNVMLTRAGEVKLVDFGVARWAGRVQCPRGGTPGFIAPEIISGGEGDARSDLYGLGRLLEKCTAGAKLSLLGRSLVQALSAESPDARPGNAEEVAAILNTCLRELGATRSIANLVRPLLPERRRAVRPELGATMLLTAPVRALGSAMHAAQIPVRAAVALSQQAVRAPAQLADYARRGVRQKIALGLVAAGVGMGGVGFCSGFWVARRKPAETHLGSQLRASDLPGPSPRYVPPLPHRRRHGRRAKRE